MNTITPTVLFCKWTSICESGVEHAFQNLGYQYDCITQLLDSVDYDKNYMNVLADKLQKKQYDYVFSINFIPIISRVCNIFKIPYVCWTVDNPCFQLYSETIKNPWNRIFMFDHSQYLKFHALNPNGIFYLPLGCDCDAWDKTVPTQEDHRKYDCDISFVGSTYEEKTRYNNIENISDYIKGYVDGLIKAQLNVYGYNFIEDSLTDEFCEAFKKCADWIPLAEDYTEDTKAIIADTYIGYKCTEQERILTLQNISEHFKLDLYTLSPTHHFPNANCRGGADSIWMLPLIYKCSKINLNMTNRPIKTGLPLRIFDIMGAGGFLLTNYQAELPDIFELGKDLVAYESQDDLLSKIAYYLEHEDERLQIAKKGQEKVRQYHSYKVKLQEITKIVLG